MKQLIYSIRWQDILDIGVLTYILYKVLLYLKGTRTFKVLLGCAVLFITYFITDYYQIITINWILNNFISSIIVILVVVFSPEIRKGLVIVGRGAMVKNVRIPKSTEHLEEVFRAVKTMQINKIGALIVFQREDDLSDYMEDATILNAKISKELLLSVFHPASPLHDGAVIVKDNIIKAAGCFLPLTTQANLSKNLGTRHRAAIGVTEETDAVSLIVSEETGDISVAVDGKITTRLSEEILDRLLHKLLYGVKKVSKK
jgi:diadenylate cyclase